MTNYVVSLRFAKKSKKEANRTGNGTDGFFRIGKIHRYMPASFSIESADAISLILYMVLSDETTVASDFVKALPAFCGG